MNRWCPKLDLGLYSYKEVNYTKYITGEMENDRDIKEIERETIEILKRLERETNYY